MHSPRPLTGATPAPTLTAAVFSDGDINARRGAWHREAHEAAKRNAGAHAAPPAISTRTRAMPRAGKYRGVYGTIFWCPTSAKADKGEESPCCRCQESSEEA